MPQIPRYILTLHELLAHTPHEHVERNSLDYAKSKLEELSRSEPWGGAGLCGTDGGGGSGSVPSFVSLPSAAPQPVSVELWNSLGACPWSSSPSFRIMHDEVSETENIRKNLAIERMIIEGCEILLDTSQTFVRQGTALLPPCPPGSVRHPVAPAVPAAPRSQLEPGMGALPAGSLIQVPMSEKGKITRGRLGSLSLRKEGERQCFLFSKHLIICTRGSGGKLHLTKVGMGGRAWHSAGAGAAAPHPAGAGFTILLLTPIPTLQNGVISLIDCTLIEEQESTDEDGRYPQCPTVPAPFLGVGGFGLCQISPSNVTVHTWSAPSESFRAGHRPSRLQDCGGAKGRLVLHRHPRGILQAGEGCLDQRHQPGTARPWRPACMLCDHKASPEGVGGVWWLKQWKCSTGMPRAAPRGYGVSHGLPTGCASS